MPEERLRLSDLISAQELIAYADLDVPEPVAAGRHELDLCPDPYCRICKDRDGEALPWVERLWEASDG